MFVYYTAHVCELVCLFQWLSFQCDGVVVLSVGFHNLCRASMMLSPIVVLTLCLAALFSVFADGCGGEERGHLQSPGPPTGSKVSTGSHFFCFL